MLLGCCRVLPGVHVAAGICPHLTHSCGRRRAGCRVGAARVVGLPGTAGYWLLPGLPGRCRGGAGAVRRGGAELGCRRDGLLTAYRGHRAHAASTVHGDKAVNYTGTNSHTYRLN